MKKRYVGLGVVLLIVGGIMFFSLRAGVVLMVAGLLSVLYGAVAKREI